MALTVNNNIASLSAQAALDNTSNALNTSLQRLSTGLKINSGADGPAALVISQEQQAQVVGLQQAISNTSEAVNLVQTGEGGLSEISNLLTQARSLALDSANSGVNDSTALAANQAQLNNILSTINNIANTTQFGTKQLLNGTAGLNVTTAPTGYNISGTATVASGTYTVVAGAGTGALPTTQTALKAESTAGTSAVATTAANDTGTITINGVSINIAASQTQAELLTTINAQSSLTGVTAQFTAGKLQFVANNFGSANNFAVTITNTTAVTGTALSDELGYSTFTAGSGTPGNSYTSVTINSQAGTVTGTGAVTPVGGPAAAAAISGTATTARNAQLTITDPTTGNAFSETANGNVVTFTSGALNGLSITLAPQAQNGTGLYTSAGAAGDAFTLNNQSLTFQIGANAGQTASVSFGNSQASALGQNAVGVTGSFTNLSNINIDTTNANTADAIRIIDKAISDVSSEQGTLGAFQTNTLQANADNLQTALTNTSAAESTITDTDYASEISNYTSLQVKLQAGASVLGNANQLPSIITSLLQKA